MLGLQEINKIYLCQYKGIPLLYWDVNMEMRHSERNVLMQDTAATFLTPSTTDKKKKMIPQTSLHSPKKLFDMDPMGLTAVMFGWA